MKRNLVVVCLTLLTIMQTQSAPNPVPQPPKPGTKAAINLKIKKSNDNIRMFNDMKKIWKNNADTLEGLDEQLVEEQANLANLQAERKTAPNK